MTKQVKSGSRENIYSLKGFGHVFRFTFLQTLKNKGFLVSAIMMILMMTFMRPLMYYMGKGGANAAQSLGDTLSNIEAEKMYILNETDIEMSRIDIAPEDAKPKEGTLNPDKVVLYGKSEANADELLGKLGAKEILVVIRPSATGYDVNAVIADTSDIQIKSMDHAVNYTRGIFESARKKQMKLDDQALKSINSGITKGGVLTVAEYADEKTHTMSKAELSGIAFGFSMLIMLVATLAGSFVITSVNEEKQSKLAESLLVSVRPMALLMGKVVGMLSFVTATVILGVIGSITMDAVMKNVMHIDMSSINTQGQFNLAIFTSYGAVGFVLFFAELIITLLSFGVFAGVLGSACSKTEDQQSATGILTMLVMVAYMVSIMGSAQETLIPKAALIPPVSYIMAPVAYVSGRIGVGELLGSIAIQIALLIGMVILAAKTYRNLLLMDASKPKLATIFQAAKG